MVVVIFIILAPIVLLFFIIYKINLYKPVLIFFIIFLLSFSFYYRVTKNYCPVINIVKTFMHLTISNYRYEELVNEKFYLDRENYKRCFRLEPEFIGRHQVIVDSNENDLSISEIGAKLKFTFYHEEKYIFEEIINLGSSSWSRKTENGTRIDVVEKFYLYRFSFPLKEKYVNDIEVCIEVIESDNSIDKPVNIIISPMLSIKR